MLWLSHVCLSGFSHVQTPYCGDGTSRDGTRRAAPAEELSPTALGSAAWPLLVSYGKSAARAAVIWLWRASSHQLPPTLNTSPDAAAPKQQPRHASAAHPPVLLWRPLAMLQTHNTSFAVPAGSFYPRTNFFYQGRYPSESAGSGDVFVLGQHKTHSSFPFQCTPPAAAFMPSKLQYNIQCTIEK